MKILILIILLIIPSIAGADVCFDDATAGRMIVELEQCRIQKDNADLLKQSLANLEEQIKLQDEMLEVYRGSFVKMKEQIGGYKKLLDDQKEYCEAEIKRVRPSIIEQAIRAFGFIGIGVLVGLLL